MSGTSKDAITKTVGVDGTAFVYREVGSTTGVPVVFLHHFTAALDDWDPAVVDGIAAERRVILVDLRGVGGSGGTTPDSVEAMAGDAIAFLAALGLSTVDLLGFSLGGMVAQVIVEGRPDLVRRVILAGTAPAGDQRPAATGAVLQSALEKASAQGKHPKHFLFFSSPATSQAAADAFLASLDERTEDRDAPVSNRNDRCPAHCPRQVGEGHLTREPDDRRQPRPGRQRRRRHHAADDKLVPPRPVVARRPAQHLPGLRPRRHLPAPRLVRGPGTGLPPHLTRTTSAPRQGSTARLHSQSPVRPMCCATGRGRPTPASCAPPASPSPRCATRASPHSCLMLNTLRDTHGATAGIAQAIPTLRAVLQPTA